MSATDLKRDHHNRPLWISEDGMILLENFSPISEIAQDFLTTIAEPVSRPSFIHEYRMTIHSLYAAVSVGLETEDIISVLDRLCKTALPQKIINDIRQCTISYGKVKLILKHQKCFVESPHASILQFLLKDSEIQKYRASVTASTVDNEDPSAGLIIQSSSDKGSHKASILSDRLQKAVHLLSNSSTSTTEDDYKSFLEAIEREQEEVPETPSQTENPASEGKSSFMFEIKHEHIDDVKRRCAELDYPTMEEYDFRSDFQNPTVPIDLKPSTIIRPYQEKSLSKMFGNGKARSGIIVLPCGAGKTLVGITAACTIRKNTLILCTSALSVEQWRQQLLHFTNIPEQNIARFTSDVKEKLPNGGLGIVISTYTMIAYTGRRSFEAKQMMEFLQGTEWGLLLLDEVHVVPANVFRRVIKTIEAHAKLGLTATLVREDEKIADLNFLIGPKLYEANWMDLARQGHIANVQCAEVWCPMTSEFYREYLYEQTKKKRLLYVMNPRKIQACQFLIQFHENRGDKIIVFSDNIFALKAYAIRLGKPYIYGPTSQAERMAILQKFKCDPNVNTIFLSKVGDTSIDIPEATCLIQISSHYGSRRQEAQRLGRILRAKRRNDEGFNAYFYSLVSKDTEEMYYSTKRQQFLIDQGYSFKIITELSGIEKMPGLVFASQREQQELLSSVLVANEADAEEEQIEDADNIEEYSSSGKKTSLRQLSGADEMSYIEYNRRTSSGREQQQQQSLTRRPRHALLRQWFNQ